MFENKVNKLSMNSLNFFHIQKSDYFLGDVDKINFPTIDILKIVLSYLYFSSRTKKSSLSKVFIKSKTFNNVFKSFYTFYLFNLVHKIQKRHIPQYNFFFYLKKKKIFLYFKTSNKKKFSFL